MDKNIPLYRKFLMHLETVNHHRAEVMKNCFACGLYRQGLTHDLSKYEPAEFLVSVKYFQGYRSPYIYEKELHGYSLGWLHHKGRNRHHWEYWWDQLDGKWVPIRMPFPYLVEMVCDRVAACRTYQKEKYHKESALEYFLMKNDAQYMHPETAKELEEILRDIAERGEDAVFHDLKIRMQEYRKMKHKEKDLRSE